MKWMKGTEATYEMGMYYLVNVPGSRVYHRCVLEGARLLGKIFVSSCGFRKRGEEVQILLPRHESGIKALRRCRQCYFG